MTKCKNDNCIHQRGDGVCRLKELTLDEYGGCELMKPATVCGKCKRYETDKCRFYSLACANDAACEEFEPMITFVNAETYTEINPSVGEAVSANDGYCPCAVERNEDTLCPCKEYRECGKCVCGRYESHGNQKIC